MPRPRHFRRVAFQPDVTFFKPAGVRITALETIVLTMEEFEAVRLKDFLGLEQETAAQKMNISQPTFYRLITSARRKIADALINGKAIRVEGGVFKMVVPRGQGRGMGRGVGRGFGGPPVACVCPGCGATLPKERGIPCASMKCPKCGMPMTRGT
jgi:predicted DNA-binding protein (UPF0251 family)